MGKDALITENFLLRTEEAVELYHEHARDMPIVDYHCHLPPRQIAEDTRFENMTRIWLYGDHYKWRVMRSNGVDERYCTGDASDWEKFQKWAECVPSALRNPVYHWAHMELKRPFGIGDRLLNPRSAKGIWDECNSMLAGGEFSCRGIMRQMNVVLVCTTDDPVSSLEYHRAIAADSSFAIKVLPTFRPDMGMAVESPAKFNEWVDRLAEASGVDIGSFSRYIEAIRRRHDFFHSMGCRVSDHGLQTMYAEDCKERKADAIFGRIRSGRKPNEAETLQFKSAMLREFAMMDAEKGWVQQFHLGALRNNNGRLYERIGPDCGCDSIGDWPVAEPLARFLDGLDRTGQLAKTILYNLNPRDNETLATMIGNFQDGSVPGKIQFGSAWWFLDNRDGMERQMEALSQMGLLSRFVGMITDSRSFLSYTRHEYFRRILCNLLGQEIHDGLLPRDLKLIGSMVRDICYNNAVRYFGFDLPEIRT